MTNRNTETKESSSFRDPAGYLYYHNKTLFRKITPLGLADYQYMLDSGLYDELTKRRYLVRHEEISKPLDNTDFGSKIIKPEKIEFISYPYEWCFSQLKAAAILTLKIQELALARGMALKDASAYNIQFSNGHPILIDTLSFERYQEGEPWSAYRQFCQHFLAPLSLMAYSDVRLNQLLRIYIDGIPLDLASRLLPFKTFLKLPLLLHIHLHARSQIKFKNKPINRETIHKQLSLQQLLGLLQNLKAAVNGLVWNKTSTLWSEYERFHAYSESALKEKIGFVERAIAVSKPKIVWDLGANTGFFSRLASEKGILTISFDIDPGAVELNYRRLIQDGSTHLLPLLLDLTNPSPRIGWRLLERQSLFDRGPVDLVFALALIHHLAIANNIPLSDLAQFFAGICEWLLIEFIPKDDPQVRKIMGVRKDIFDDYELTRFEEVFGSVFRIIERDHIRDTSRTMYLMKKI